MNRNMKETIKNKAALWALLVLGAVFLLAAGLFDWSTINTYKSYSTDTLSYDRARVISIDGENLEKDEEQPSRLYLGTQDLTVRFIEGDQKGETVTLTNYLTRSHNIMASEGQVIIVCADTPQNAEAYYTVYNYDRTVPLALLVALFAAAMLAVGHFKGFKALLGVTYSLLAVVLFMVQAIYHGFSPVGVSLLVVLMAGGISLVLLNGVSKKSIIGFICTFGGVLITGVIFLVFSLGLHISGYTTDAAETLVLASNTTGLGIRWLLLAGVLVSALGAVMDVAVSLTAALDELYQHDPTLTAAQIIRSGMNIGKDMIGTMSNTLILAFAGAQLNTMLCLLAYGYSFRQLMNSDYMATELAQGICATIGVVLTVPMTSVILALIYTAGKKKTPPKGVQYKAKQKQKAKK